VQYNTRYHARINDKTPVCRVLGIFLGQVVKEIQYITGGKTEM